MPPLRRKKRVSSSTKSAKSNNMDHSEAPSQPPIRLSPSKELMRTPARSPLNTVRGAAITKSQRDRLAEDLTLELTERARKMRAQYQMQAQSLKQRIEMRINRVPKKLWKMTMGDLLAQAEGPDVIKAAAARKLVGDVKRLSAGTDHDQNKERPIVTKKRAEKKPASAVAPSARERMPPPPVPQPSYMSPTKVKQQPHNSSSPGPSSPPPNRAASPVKRAVKSSRTRAPVSKSRPISRATARSSIETAGTGMMSGNEGGYTSGAASRGTKASQAKAKAAAEAKAAAANGLKRGGVKGAGSNGSLKENKVAGVKEPAVKKAATGRVLRSRK